jgi:hypothetical protein
MIAAQAGHTAIVQALLKAGADVSVKNRDGATASVLAAEKGHATVLDLLVPLLKEVVAVKPDPSGVEASGDVKFRGTEGDDLSIFLSGGITLVYKRGEPTSVRTLYFPGIRHQFHGRCRMPVSPSEITDGYLNFFLHNTGSTNLSMEMTENGMVMKEGTGLWEGTGKLIFEKKSQVLDITASESHPLTFLVTLQGYKYQSGKGTVRLPNGKDLSFP